ncbi:hypothetical protein [Calothrix sp. PCC 6303]|uniref:hypothetical protein n=1 Tax=Calothrix sp. PCC 6303 TaxID=1170562 RepID=UPI0002A00362|nr:hypothetical protein [Calothrix sp. PCC 6303]AFY99457.1 hypothetical protein Cal6303_0377 [Calothrix sp. PCC 6303]
MPDIFVVDAGDANSIQQRYEQVIEMLLQALLDAKQNNTKQGLKIFDDDKLVYGRDNNQFSDEISGLSGELLNPQLIIQLQQLRSTPVGEVVEGAINKRVELDGKVVLQSDKDGRVIVNELLQKEIVQDIGRENIEGFKSTETNHNSEEIIYPEFSSIENNQIDNTKTQVAGSIRVAESLNTLEDSPLKTLLNAELEQLRSEIKALQQEHNLYEELIHQRLQQPQNTSWWQDLKNKTSIVINSFTSAVKIGISEYQNNSTQHQFAASIKNLFRLQTQPGENQYQTDKYQISRSGSLYEIKDSATNKQIMQFQTTPLGLRVERSNLEKHHIKDFTTLQTSLQQNHTVPNSFAPVGRQEAEYFTRVERVSNALIQYAVAQQKEVTIDGAFSYKWQANPNGDVQIKAKDGRGNLLEKTGGSVKSNMSERDLVYFEQILPKLQTSSKKEAVNSLKLTNHQER